VSDRFKNIIDLFELPGSEGELIPAETQGKEGRTAEESRTFGQERMAAGDYQAAVEHFQKAIQQGSAESVAELGAAYEAGDFIPQAYVQYRKALQSQANGDVAIGVAALMKREGRWKDSIAELQAAIEKEPYNAFLHFRLAETLREARYPKAALAAVQGAIANQADDAFYHFWAAELALELKRFEESLGAIHAALELNQDDPYYLAIAGAASWGCGREEEARAFIKQAVRDSEGDAAYIGVARQLGVPGFDGVSVGEYDASRTNRFLRPIGLEIPD